MNARPLHKTDIEARQRERILRLQNQLDKERGLRVAAEANAARFHALLLAARVQLIRERKQT